MAKKEAEEKVRVGKKSAGDWAVDIFITIIFGLFTIVCIFPFYYIFINTISNNNLVMTGKISLFPQGDPFPELCQSAHPEGAAAGPVRFHCEDGAGNHFHRICGILPGLCFHQE